MQSIRKILVAVKDTKHRRTPAVTKAALLAQALGAQLELFHAISQPVPVDAYSSQGLNRLLDTRRNRHMRQLETMAGPLRRLGISVTTTVEWDYPIYDAVIRGARRSRADLIVAGRHATRHAAPWVLRYADWELLRQSPVPVLLVKRTRRYRAPVILAAVDPMHAFSKTAQLDGAILAMGKQLQDAMQGDLHVMHAYVPSPSGLTDRQLSVGNATQLIADRSAQRAQKLLDQTLRQGDMDQLHSDRRHLLPLHPVNSIPLLARRIGCDIVVMGAVSRSGLRRLVIGNTAERLLDALPCDVLVVKPAGFVSRVPGKVRGPELFYAAPPSGLL